LPKQIAILSSTLTHRIAAGEVVERPASIVKELVENALDAGAGEVYINLEGGGCEEIRVADNGVGIPAAEVPLAFARYATSKISQFEDLYGIHSFGFRGEALPSIASIARVEMVTRSAAETAGICCVVEAGEVRECRETGAPVGTSLIVSRIFSEVPVRRKFLKSDLAEQGACIDAITRLALACPEVTFRVSVGGKPLLHIPGTDDLSERIGLTLGRDLASALVKAAEEKAGAKLEGFVSRPTFTRSNASQIYIYVNGRFVKDHLLNHAVMTAYRRIIAPRRYPAAVLALELAPADVDVNVHPAKLEVRFRYPREIYGLIVTVIQAAVGVTPESADHVGEPEVREGRGDYVARVEEALKRYRISTGTEKLFFTGYPRASRGEALVLAEPSPPSSLTEPLATGWALPEKEKKSEGEGGYGSLRYLGQVADTYLVFADATALVLVDQHAAHERILYEKLKDRTEGGAPQSQRLLLPEVVSLPPRELAFLADSAPILAEAGLEVEPFGGDSLVVKAVPSFLSPAEARQLILDILSDYGETDRRLPLTDRRERLLMSLACRGAVKAKRELSVAEVGALCRELDAFSQEVTCPHGRPVRLTFSVVELEKRFQRR